MMLVTVFIVLLLNGVDKILSAEKHLSEKFLMNRFKRQTQGTTASYNCGTGGVTESDSVLHMDALGSSWPAGAFCQNKWKDASSFNNEYTFSLSFKCIQNDVCHPGLMFNWQDQQNYEFVYLRTHNADYCYVYGYVINGVVKAVSQKSRCGTPIANQKWSQLKVVLRDGIARTYVDGRATGSEWTHHFSGGSVGAAACNGYNDKIDYNNFALFKDYHNCGNGIVSKDCDIYHMEAFGLKWNQDHFCQIPWQDARPYGESYSFSAAFNCKQNDYCHPGLMFNWQNENNYDFVYVRSHLPLNCFVYGSVKAGIATVNNPNIKCGSNVVNRKWIQLKVHIKGDKVQAYVNEMATGNEWTATFSSGIVGAAAANGYTDVIDYKDFTLAKDFVNCGTGCLEISSNVYTMKAFGLKWPENLFCQVPWKDTRYVSRDYDFSLYFNCIQDDVCHPGLMFNWKDENNYDLLYLRTHSPTSCFVYGFVANGVLSLTDPRIACGSPIANRKWSQIKISVKNNKAQAFVDGIMTGSEWSPKFSGGYVGAAAANGYNDIINYKNFRLIKNHYNCGNGMVSKQNNVYHMEAFGAKWSEDHFCQIPWQDATPYGAFYSFSAAFNCKQNDYCHPGLMFNWQDEENYDFIYVRSHLPNNCFVYGSVKTGVVTVNNPNIKCGSDVVNMKWIQLKVHIRGSKVQAYVNEKAAGNEWTATFSSGIVGAAAANGYTDVIDYKDFTLVKDSANCGSGGLEFSNDTYKMSALGAKWPENHFCQIPWKDTQYVTEDYEFSVDFNCVQDDVCHPGLMFNWKDEKNYDFVYLRTHNSAKCFVYGFVVNGIPTIYDAGIPCGTSIANHKWSQLKISMKNNKVQAFVDGVKTGTDWSPKFTAGYVGAAAANGYKDVINYKGFRLVEGDYNCGSGLITKQCDGIYNMEAYGIKWSEDHFCQIMWRDATFYNDTYTFMLSFYCVQSNECHPGLMFNWQNEYNYDFIYVRTHWPHNCFVYGWVKDGVVTAFNPKIACGSPVKNNEWVQLKVKLSHGKAKAYVDGISTGNDWQYQFDGGYVGAAAANGYKDLIDYKDFALVKDYYNCGNGGVTVDTQNQRHMVATGLKWPQNHFCQIVYKDTYLFERSYTFSLSFNCTQTDACHPGLMFNWQDYRNYDFFYVRTHNSASCFVYGWVINGVVKTFEGGRCGNSVANQQWIQLKVTLKGGKSAQAYVNNAATGNAWNSHFSSGFVGAAAANGYNDVIDYTNFSLSETSNNVVVIS